MSDCHVVAIIEAHAGDEAAVKSALQTLTEQAQTEDGCLDYELFESTAQANTFITVERWVSVEHLNAHLQAPSLTSMMAEYNDKIADITIHRLSKA